MRIGILTLPLHTNYGGILQAYALQTVLEKMGHEVVVFDTPQHLRLPIWKMPLAYLKRSICKYILKQDVKIFYEQRHNKIYPILSQNIQMFIRQYIHRYEIRSFKDIKKSDFDCIIVGSDQVWRPKYFEQLFRTKISNAFLEFTSGWNIKRIVYAASFGTDKWEYSKKMTRLCSQLIRKFNGVSLREDVGVDLCRKYLKIEAENLLDPTLLLCKEDYIQLAKMGNNIMRSKEYLATYILDDSDKKQRIVKQVLQLRNFSQNILMPQNKFTDKYVVYPSIELWLQGFINASFVVTDSFHGTVFSIMFNKPFISIANDERGISRFTSLLKKFNLEDRLIHCNEEVNLDLINKPINFNSINASIIDEVNDAKRFLKLHLV